MKKESTDILRQMVRGRYAQAAAGTGCGCQTKSDSGCCGSGANDIELLNRIMGYSQEALGSIVESPVIANSA